MDLRRLIQDLLARKAKIQKAIDELEKLVAAPKTKSRRGRRSMGAQEREEVSARMKKYWEAKRREKD